MQSVCLDEFGGEKVVPPRAQETTLIQHIFGGHLQSQVNSLKKPLASFSNDCIKEPLFIIDKIKKKHV